MVHTIYVTYNDNIIRQHHLTSNSTASTALAIIIVTIICTVLLVIAKCKYKRRQGERYDITNTVQEPLLTEEYNDYCEITALLSTPPFHVLDDTKFEMDVCKVYEAVYVNVQVQKDGENLYAARTHDF